MNKNPYPVHTKEHEAWNLERMGFNQAQIKQIQSQEKSSRFDLSYKHKSRSDRKPLTM